MAELAAWDGMNERRHLWVAFVLLSGGTLLSIGAVTGLRGIAQVGYAIAGPIMLLLGALVAAGVAPAGPAMGVALTSGIVVFMVRLATLAVDETADVLAVEHLAFRGIVLLSGAAFIALGPVKGLVLSALTWIAGTIALASGPMPIGLGQVDQGVVGVAVTSAVAILMFRLLSSSVAEAKVQAEVAQSSAELAFLDDLTGLPNRRQMTAHLAGAVARAVEGGGPDTLVMFDLDHFKEVNDTLGHDAGDEVLRRTAAVATATLREGDVLCRWGGEEFLVLLSNADETEAVAIAERCRRALEAVQGRTAVTASFGVTRIDSADTVTDALRRADMALYAAKTGGRNQVVVRHPGEDF
ncbi:MAG TPA: GGDEF domain-containing protein [Euzebya sp.]|nr:GGDEF domain-containing protein [Euzebya sp.]